MVFINAELVICPGCGHAVLPGEGICLLCGTALLSANAPLDADYSRERDLVDSVDDYSLAAKDCV